MSNQITMGPDLVAYMNAIQPAEHPVLATLRERTAAMPMAVMQISPAQGRFMSFLVRLLGVRRAIEVGVFTGYSALAVALALPTEGRLVALDVSEEWTAVAREAWAEAGVDGRIDLRLAPARDSLDAMIAEGQAGGFDFAFIDADKSGYVDYYERLLVLLRPGGVIAVDNVFFDGAAVPGADLSHLSDGMAEAARAIHRFNAHVRDDPRIDLAVLPIGDGLTLIAKR